MPKHTQSAHRLSLAFRLIISLVTFLTFQTAYAEPSGTNPAPIKISADRLIVNDKQGISRYQGSVEIKQGEMELHGDEIEVRYQQNQLQQIKITGNPANFKLVNDKTGKMSQGQAETILYLEPEQLLTFSGNAILKEDGKHQISGSKLIYDLQKQTLKAQSSPQKKQRVEVILTPESSK